MEQIINCDKQKTFLELLKIVIDPEIGINIVDLGLIYSLNLDENKKLIQVFMTLTTSGCPMGDIIVSDVNDILKDHYPDYRSEVILVWEPRWNYEMISPEGIQFLEN